MEPIKIAGSLLVCTKLVGYLMVIVALEGALHEYQWITTPDSNADAYHTDHHTALKKESALTSRMRGYEWYDALFALMQKIWALLLGATQGLWQKVRTWIQLMLVIFECSELVHKLSTRFNLWGGLRHIL